MEQVYDYIVIGSGFGGSVSALRLVEKGYSVLVLERGKRYRDQDFARTNLSFWKFLWAPALRCFGILQIVPYKDVLVLQGSGVGGGSLGYANVLMQPDDHLFANPSWKHLQDWKTILLPHFATARRMLGVTPNPCLWPADDILREIATELGTQSTLHPTEVGVFFGDGNLPEGEQVPDPYFGGEGPARNTCTQCGGCMVGCRYNAKNTLTKNYLYLAEKWGAQVQAEAQVTDVRPLPAGQPDGARYEVVYRRSTAWFFKPERRLRARNVVFSASASGTMSLLFRCRQVTGSLPRLSPRLGELVRTNSESLLGATSPNWKTDYSKGIAITSIFQADAVTAIEPVRYPKGSSLMRTLVGPMMEPRKTFGMRLLQTLRMGVLHPLDFYRSMLMPGWAERTTIMLVMQTEDNLLKMRFKRSPLTLFKRGLVSEPDEENPIPVKIDIGHQVAKRFAQKIRGTAALSIFESLFNTPMTAHILGGCPFGRDDQEGVIGLDCQLHNYPGLYVVDGSLMPGNPGVNPSLTITALAEYAMSQVPDKPGGIARQPIGVERK